ncbi:molybdopterin-dependent oxidoreductase [Amycolatopsis sp. WAC 04169]|uniref:molybdopterin-dependent oxidoreductase n=1 Tax=Amycolatopsis sp. WAC 04169 TaxID=2203197 RepID=UPI0018F70E0C|nr:molybdopterin-dependent oxidoreductase [Amycolatopsis sp. WAC 04169]
METSRTAREPRLPVFGAALIGVVALAAALAAGHLVAGFISANASPYLAVGNGAIDLTPVGLKDFAVRTFGVYDKLVLLGGMAVVMVLAAAVAGMASRRSPVPGITLIAAFGLLGGFAVAQRPDLSAVALLAPLASLIAGVGVFFWLHRLASAGPQSEVAGASRRSVLLAGAGAVVAAGAAGVGGQLLAGTRDAESSRAAVGRLVPAEPAPPIPADADFAKLGTPTFLTSNRDFYRVDTALSVPQVRAEDWSLRLHGMVREEKRFSYDDIRGRPLIERTITMTCVSNEVGGNYVSTANFIGVDLGDLLREAGILPGAEQIHSTSVDGWTAGSPVIAALDPERGAMLAIGMNGEPLPVEHGFPARMVIPGLYGYVSATKWVKDLEITTWKARRAYWLERGWGEQAPIKTQSRIDSPKGFETVPAGKVRVSGVAWAQHTGIERVEVRLGANGSWLPATLSREVGVDTWRMWWIEFDVPAGSHQVTVRAVDKSGYTQTDARAGTVPDGATGRHVISFTAR